MSADDQCFLPWKSQLFHFINEALIVLNGIAWVTPAISGRKYIFQNHISLLFSIENNSFIRTENNTSLKCQAKFLKVWWKHSGTQKLLFCNKNYSKKSKESMQLKLDHLIRCNIDIPWRVMDELKWELVQFNERPFAFLEKLLLDVSFFVAFFDSCPFLRCPFQPSW